MRTFIRSKEFKLFLGCAVGAAVLRCGEGDPRLTLPGIAIGVMALLYGIMTASEIAIGGIVFSAIGLIVSAMGECAGPAVAACVVTMLVSAGSLVWRNGRAALVSKSTR